MPYQSKKDLPPSTNKLSPHQKEIYQKAFNNAWEEYKSPKERNTKEMREEVAHKVAWAAVQRAKGGR